MRLKIIVYCFVGLVLILAGLCFIPRSYKVPKIVKRSGTKFWNLSTGSVIGYTYIPAKNNRKPFPIIFLHGGPGGFFSDEFISVLSNISEDGYDIYLYDQIGSGQSARLNNIKLYTPERQVKDLEAIIKKIGASKVILIGQSWGAILASLFVVAHPNDVAKIIFTCPGPIYPFNPTLKNSKAPDSLQLKEPKFSNAQGNKKANNLRIKTVEFFAKEFGIKIASDEEVDSYQTFLNTELNKSTVINQFSLSKPQAGGGYYAGLMTYHNLLQIADPRPVLQKTAMPVLVLKAQYDNQPWGFTNEYLTLFKNHQLILIPNAGHAIYLEQPDLYLKAIREFLSKTIY
jgi:proline iminopeptidase